MYTFSPISDRVKRVREKCRSTVPYVDTARYRVVTDFYMAHPELTGILKRAYNFKNMCEKMPVIIGDDDMVIGTYVTTYRASALYPENSIDFLIDELNSGLLSEREVDPYLITDEDKEYILSTADFWMHECMNSKLNPYIPERFSEIVDGGPLFFTPKNICSQPVGHFVANYDKAIRVGFAVVRDEAREKMAQLEANGFAGNSADQYSFYRAVVAVCDGIITFAKRYSRECARLAEQCSCPERKHELEQLAEIMDHIMERPAANFREAIQALWFYQMCIMMDANMHGASIGRVDQFLGSFAEADLASGAITREEAQELVDLYYLNIAAMNKVWSARTALSNPGYTSGQLITIGGRNADGSDASNVVTFMCLEAVGRLILHSPPQALRIHAGTPKKLWDCALSVNRISGGVPAFFSDESIEPALIRRGISPDDAWDYSLVGCVEPSAGGKEWPACGGIGISTYFNLVNTLLLAINNGKNYRPGPDGKISDIQFGPETGYLYEMTDIEQVKEAYLIQQRYWVQWHVNAINMFESIAREILPQPLVSAMMEGCMESGTDVMKGGARYNSTGHSCIGLGNIADCFNAIDWLCFREKRCTTRELYDALLHNWEGYEELHNIILNEVPRYGNGIPENDRYCAWAADEYAKCVNSMTGPRGRYAAGAYPVTMNVVYGRFTAASPDGRVSGEPLSDGISAMQGMDRNGPLAALRSISCFDQSQYGNGTLLNMKIPPSSLVNDTDMDKLISVMSTYFQKLGGMEMQLNIISSDTLRDAQKHPENYRDLIVRIAGFSAYFVDVYKGAQDDLIRRTELSI